MLAGLHSVLTVFDRIEMFDTFPETKKGITFWPGLCWVVGSLKGIWGIGDEHTASMAT
ncbi:MAG: hypothetical protein ACP5UU_05835 [Thermoprotei archaeon]